MDTKKKLKIEALSDVFVVIFLIIVGFYLIIFSTKIEIFTDYIRFGNDYLINQLQWMSGIPTIILFSGFAILCYGIKRGIKDILDAI